LTVDTSEVFLPVVRRTEDFDHRSGSRLERMIFNHRIWVVMICLLITAVLGWRASKLEVNANFEQMIPQSHPFIRNYFDNKESLKGLGNSIRIVVENTQGDIFDPAYLEVLKQVNDTIFLTPGVDRAMMRSVWMPLVRWTEITEEGARGGPVMPFNYDGSPDSVKRFKANVLKAGIRGDIVGNDFKSAMIVVPLLDKVADTGQPIDYKQLSHHLEQNIRDKFQGTAAGATGPYKIHIVGFAKLVGDLIDGLVQVINFFAASAVIATVLIFLYTRDWRSTLLLVVTAISGVVWLLGLLELFGFDLNPYSILVPFLIFAIGISHGAQKMNGVMQDIGRGTHRYVAARYTFRRLFMAGFTALLTNIVGFAVLMIIDIPVIRDLALATSLGVTILVFTKLCFIPVALSYIGVSQKAALRSLSDEEHESHGGVLGGLWNFLGNCTQRRYAVPLLMGAMVVGIASATISLTRLKIGDLDPGAPELRPNSRYNQDVAFINAHYGLSSDQFAVIVKTQRDGMIDFESLVEQDRLAWRLRHLPGVLTTNSLAEGVRKVTFGQFEGNPKWLTIPRNASSISQSQEQTQINNPGLRNGDASVAPLVVYLRDHRADTLDEMVRTVQAFAAEHDTKDRRFLLAAGSAGIEATTNIVVRQANYRMLGLLYAAVALLCFVTFRSWRAVIVAMVPLLITSFLCEALMVFMGIGVKVATLPVIALGVGVGVDYALYLLSVQLTVQRQGETLKAAYNKALRFTGKVVGLIGVTMAAGVVTWAWSPIKFQADMGVLLTFMFLWNMLGALLLIPALSHFLLRPKSEIAGDTHSKVSRQTA